MPAKTDREPTEHRQIETPTKLPCGTAGPAYMGYKSLRLKDGCGHRPPHSMRLPVCRIPHHSTRNSAINSAIDRSAPGLRHSMASILTLPDSQNNLGRWMRWSMRPQVRGGARSLRRLATYRHECARRPRINPLRRSVRTVGASTLLRHSGSESEPSSGSSRNTVVTLDTTSNANP